MKYISTLVIFLTLGAMEPYAQVWAATPVALPLSAQPEKNPVPRSVGWTQECADRVAAIKGKPCDVIFIGDSITQNFVGNPMPAWDLVGGQVWEKHYANRNALNFGVGSDNTRNVLWRLENMDIKDLRPKAAVILIGTNNTKDTPADIAAGVKAVVDKTRATFPGVKVILVSILPTARETQRMAEANKTIRTFGDNRDVFYLDLAAKMPPEGSSWKGLGNDRLHLRPEAYELWATEMEPLLKKLLP